MKKFVLILFLIFTIFPLLSAVELKIKDSFQQGETINILISGTFIEPLTKSNIFFYKDHYKIPVDFELNKFNKEYYLSASLSEKSEGNYSISLENIKYNQGASISQEPLKKNFIITNQTADFSVESNPFSTKGNFFIKIKNLNESRKEVKISVISNSSNERKIFISINGGLYKDASTSLISGETKIINFELGEGDSALQFIKFSSENSVYEMPIYTSNLEIDESSPDSKVNSFKVIPSQAVYSIPTKKVVKKTFYLYNEGDSVLRDISISVSDSLVLFTGIPTLDIRDLQPNSIKIPVEINFSSEIETQIEGIITFKAGEKTLSSTISITFFDNTSSSSTQPDIEYSLSSCEESHGIICNSTTQKCSELEKTTTSGLCCLGTCDPIPNDTSRNKVIAVSIIIFIVILSGWFYFKKFKGTKRSVNLLRAGKRN